MFSSIDIIYYNMVKTIKTHSLKKGVGVGGADVVVGGGFMSSWFGGYAFYFWIVIILLLIIIFLLFREQGRGGGGGGGDGGWAGDRIKSFSSRLFGGGCDAECQGVKRGMNDPYVPPLKNDNSGFFGTYGVATRDGGGGGGGGGGFAVNIETRNMGRSRDYTQIGILTNNSSGVVGEPKILPLMGRAHLTGRDKWQYYTISNSGMVNTKLPVMVKGKSGMGERGCDEIMDGDLVFVQGYNDKFVATVYENCTNRYLPSF